MDKKISEQQQEALKRKIYIKGLPSACDKLKLHQAFSKYGEVDKAFVMYNHKNGSTRGFGFVEFVKEATVAKVLKIPVEICGKEVQVSMAVQRGKDVSLFLTLEKESRLY